MTKKKIYEQPQFEVTEMLIQSVIATSGDVNADTPDNWGWNGEVTV